MEKSLTLSSDSYLLSLLTEWQPKHGPKQSADTDTNEMPWRSLSRTPFFINESLTARELFPSCAGNFKRSLRTIKPDDISSGYVLGNTLLGTAPRFNGNQNSPGTRPDWAGAVTTRWSHTPTRGLWDLALWALSTKVHGAKVKSQPCEVQLQGGWVITKATSKCSGIDIDTQTLEVEL